MGIEAILVVTLLAQGETSSSKQFDFPTLDACERARTNLLELHKRAVKKNPNTPEILVTCAAF